MEVQFFPKCINRNRALNICISEECKHPNPFICGNCQCMQLHRNCINPEWTNIKNRIEETRKLNHPEFIKHSSAVEQIIHKAITYLTNQLQYFNVWKSTFGMPTGAFNLFISIQNNKQHKFSGKQVAQILKDIKTEKVIKKYNEAFIRQQIKEVVKKMEQVQKLLREMYSVWEFPQESIQQVKVYKTPQITVKKIEVKKIQEKPIPVRLVIKQANLRNLNKKLANLSQNPTELVLLWMVMVENCDLTQFAKQLKNTNLKSLRTLKLYYPNDLGQYSYAEQLIVQSLLSLPELQLVQIIANDIRSLDEFKSLGSKLKTSTDELWYTRQKWKY